MKNLKMDEISHEVQNTGKHGFLRFFFFFFLNHYNHRTNEPEILHVNSFSSELVHGLISYS